MLIRIWKNTNSHSLLVGCKIVQNLGRHLVSYKAEHSFSMIKQCTLRGTCLHEWNTYIHPKMYTQRFIRSFIIIANNWNSLRCSFIKWMVNKLCYSHTTNITVTKKKLATQPQRDTGNLKCISLREIVLSENCVILTVWLTF